MPSGDIEAGEGSAHPYYELTGILQAADIAIRRVADEFRIDELTDDIEVTTVNCLIEQVLARMPLFRSIFRLLPYPSAWPR